MIDLHTHTNISDGTLSPTELIRLAKDIGLAAIAITDHDSIEGLDEADQEAQKLGVRLIKGIEFDVSYKGLRIHILGLNIDHTNNRFLQIYNEYRKGKEEAIEYNLKELAKAGLHIQKEALISCKVGRYMDRMTIAKYLVHQTIVSSMPEAWINYIDDIPMHEQDLIPVDQAIHAIHLAGGKAFLAHFHLPIGLGTLSEEEALITLNELKAFGLDGMEYYYPSYTTLNQTQCKSLMEAFGFIGCGGTDFHGLNRKHIQLGVGEGDFLVPDEVLQVIQ